VAVSPSPAALIIAKHIHENRIFGHTELHARMRDAQIAELAGIFDRFAELTGLALEDAVERLSDAQKQSAADRAAAA